MRTWIGLGALILLLSRVTWAQVPIEKVGPLSPTSPAGKLKAKVDAVVKSHVDKAWYVGLIIGVVTKDYKDGAIYYYGERSIGAQHHAPTDKQTSFRIGSVSKTFTATLLALDAARGCVTVTDPCAGALAVGIAPTRLQKVLDDIHKDKWNLDRPRDGILLEQLADHHSGLPRIQTRDACNWQDDLDALACQPNIPKTHKDCSAPTTAARCPEPQTSYVASDDKKPDCGITYKKSDPTTCPSQSPGTQYIYSNWGYAVLGYALAEAYGACKPAKPAKGDDWFHVVQTQILIPLGMRHTYIDNTGEKPLADLNLGYSYDGCKGGPDDDYPGCTHDKADDHTPATDPAGGLWLTGPDMMIWLRFLMGLKPLVGAQDIDELYSLRPLLQCPRADGDGGNGRIGLGWEIGALGDDIMVWKGGDWNNFHAYVAYLPDKGVGVFVMSNSSSSGESKKNLGHDILEAIR